jgi:gliding motility-associated-like protein
VSPYQYHWSNGSTGGDLFNVGPGAYAVTVNDVNGCWVSASFALVYQYNFTIDANPSVTIGYGESTTLSYTLTGNAGNYVSVWTPPATLSCSDCVSPDASPSATTVYQIYVINDAGCRAVDNVTVYLEADHSIFVPNVFTPNGDGNNDFFEIYGHLKTLAFLEIQVFNRWGEKVFQSNDLHFKWDGTYKGVMQNPAVFVWQLKLAFQDGHPEELRKGSVSIVR